MRRLTPALCITLMMPRVCSSISPGHIGVNAILSRHGGVQRFVVQNIALDHTHTLLVGYLFQAFCVP